jgi:hypothetical protein
LPLGHILDSEGVMKGEVAGGLGDSGRGDQQRDSCKQHALAKHRSSPEKVFLV